MKSFILLASLAFSPCLAQIQIPIGTIFKKTGMEEMNDVFNAMSFAIESHSGSNRSRDFMLKFFVDKIDTVDSYKLTKVICKQVKLDRGIILSRTRVKKGPFKIGPPVIGYIFSYNQLCEVDHH